MKNKFYLVCFLTLVFITVCSSQKEVKTNKQINKLDYSGSEIIHICSAEELSLFKENVKVIVSENQSFALINKDFQYEEYTEGQHKINKSDSKDINSCYFINYNEVSENKFGTATPLSYKDSTYGHLELTMYGNYTYRVVNSKNISNTYTNLENLNQIIIKNIINVLSRYIQLKTDYHSILELQITQNEIEEINKLISKYGVEITQINVLGINWTDESEKIIRDYNQNQISHNNNVSNETLVSQIVIDSYILSKEEGGRHTPFFLKL